MSFDQSCFGLVLSSTTSTAFLDLLGVYLNIGVGTNKFLGSTHIDFHFDAIALFYFYDTFPVKWLSWQLGGWLSG